jgi:hypothetical protein
MKSQLRLLLLTLSLLAPASALAQQSTAISQPETISVIITPIAQSVGLSNSTVTTLGPNNAGTVVGAITLVTNPPGSSTAGITLSIDSICAKNFVLSSTTMPSNLAVGTANIAGGTSVAPVTYPCTITALP